MSPRREAFLATVDRSWARVEAYLREHPEHEPAPARQPAAGEAAALEEFLGALALNDIFGALDVARGFGLTTTDTMSAAQTIPPTPPAAPASATAPRPATNSNRRTSQHPFSSSNGGER